MMNWVIDLIRREWNTQTTPKVCDNCNNYSTGHIDRRVNYMRCAKGHRLIADEEMRIDHQLYGDLEEKTLRVTASGWYDTSDGKGLVMLGREDCPDWKARKFRLDLGNPEYD